MREFRELAAETKQQMREFLIENESKQRTVAEEVAQRLYRQTTARFLAAGVGTSDKQATYKQRLNDLPERGRDYCMERFHAKLLPYAEVGDFNASGEPPLTLPGPCLSGLDPELLEGLHDYFSADVGASLWNKSRVNGDVERREALLALIATPRPRWLPVGPPLLPLCSDMVEEQPRETYARAADISTQVHLQLLELRSLDWALLCL